MYEMIFDVIEENMNKGGKSFPYKKSTFLKNVGVHPQNINVSNYLELENEDFFEAFYVSVYNRLPDEKIQNIWKDKMNIEKS